MNFIVRRVVERVGLGERRLFALFLPFRAERLGGLRRVFVQSEPRLTEVGAISSNGRWRAMSWLLGPELFLSYASSRHDTRRTIDSARDCA